MYSETMIMYNLQCIEKHNVCTSTIKIMTMEAQEQVIVNTCIPKQGKCIVIA